MNENEQIIEMRAAQLVAHEVKSLLITIEDLDEVECFGAWTENGNVYFDNNNFSDEIRQRAKEMSDKIEPEVDAIIQMLYGNVLV